MRVSVHVCVSVCLRADGMWRFRRSSSYSHLRMWSFSKWCSVCVTMVRLCVTAAESKHTPRRRLTELGRIRGKEMGKYGEAVETMMRMETTLQGRKGRREKPNKSSNISSRDVIHCSFLFVPFPSHSRKRRQSENTSPATKGTTLHIFSLLHNFLWSQWKTNSVHFIFSFSIKML